MREKIVLKGEICDVCGRLINPFMNEDIYNPDTGRTEVRCEKNLKVGMMTPLNQYNNPCYGYGNIEKRKLFLCARCALRFERMFCDWIDECKKDGEQEREKRRLDIERKWAEGKKE